MRFLQTARYGPIKSLQTDRRVFVFIAPLSPTGSSSICQPDHPSLREASMNDFRSGYIAIIGRPNVGKSTLVNALLKQKIAAVSPKPQTTRKRQLGILTMDKYQLVFVDTPGLHSPRHKLGKFLNQEAEESLEG